MVHLLVSRPILDFAGSVLYTGIVALFAVLLVVTPAGATPGTDDPLTGTPEPVRAPTDAVNGTVNETVGHVVDTATNVTDDERNDSNESGGVAPSPPPTPPSPTNLSDDEDPQTDPFENGEDSAHRPSRWSGADVPQSVTERTGSVPRRRFGPPRGERTPENGHVVETGELDGSTVEAVGGSRFADASSSSALSSSIPLGGEGGCRGCSVVGGAGVVLALGVSRRLGTTASIGVSLPESATVSSLQTATHQLDRRLPRLPPLLPGQYSRRDDSDPLAHSRRSELTAAISGEPGIPLTTLSDRMDVPRSSIRYHVRVLEHEDEIETARVLGRRRVFPTGENAELVAALADEGTCRIVTTLVQIQPATGSEIADETGKSNSTVSYHLERLAEAGVVERERDGKRVSNRLTDDAEELVTDGDGWRAETEPLE